MTMKSNLCICHSFFIAGPSEKEKKRAQVLKEEGNSLVKKGEHKKAIEKYNQSIQLNPNEVTTYTNRWH